jgi:hypothetical protein
MEVVFVVTQGASEIRCNGCGVAVIVVNPVTTPESVDLYFHSFNVL